MQCFICTCIFILLLYQIQMCSCLFILFYFLYLDGGQMNECVELTSFLQAMCTAMYYTVQRFYRWKEGNVLFNYALNTFYLRLYGVGHMVKNHSE